LKGRLGAERTRGGAPTASACSFAGGAALPLLVTALAPEAHLIPLVSGASLAYLALLGGVAARVGGARVTVGALRVTFWGALAMGLTADWTLLPALLADAAPPDAPLLEVNGPPFAVYGALRHAQQRGIAMAGRRPALPALRPALARPHPPPAPACTPTSSTCLSSASKAETSTRRSMPPTPSATMPARGAAQTRSRSPPAPPPSASSGSPPA